MAENTFFVHPDAKFYRTFSLSNVGKLYNLVMADKDNRADESDLFAAEKDKTLSCPERRLLVLFCSANCSPHGYKKILQSLKTYTPEDAEVLVATRKV